MLGFLRSTRAHCPLDQMCRSDWHSSDPLPTVVTVPSSALDRGSCDVGYVDTGYDVASRAYDRTRGWRIALRRVEPIMIVSRWPSFCLHARVVVRCFVPLIFAWKYEHRVCISRDSIGVKSLPKNRVRTVFRGSGHLKSGRLSVFQPVDKPQRIEKPHKSRLAYSPCPPSLSRNSLLQLQAGQCHRFL